jgi:lipopolysaccharide export system protein LptA
VILTQGKNVVRGTKLTINMLTGESVIDSEGGEAWSATAAPNAKDGSGFAARPGAGNRPSAIFYPRDKKGAEKKPPSAASGGANSGGGWAPAAPSP